MKKYLFSLMMMVVSASLITSCLSDDDKDKGSGSSTVTVTSGLYVINNGVWGQNNGSLTYFDYTSLQPKQLLIGTDGLGDTPNDAYTKGDTIFVVGSTENTIFVIDKKNFNIIKRISTVAEMGEEEGNTPRHITGGYGDNIYFTTYGGYVGIIDAKTLTMSQIKYKVGSAPEGLTIGGTTNDPILYVANSDYGYGNASISKISLTSGVVEEIKNEKIQNPQEIVAYGDELYILDWGHYDELWNQIDAGLYYYYNGNITRLIDNATGLGVGMVYVNGSVAGYRLATFNAPYGSSEITYSTYDTYQRLPSTLKLSGDSGHEIFSPAAIAIDPIKGYIVVASRQKDPDSGYASYTLPGYANMYSTSGEYIKDSYFQTGVEPHMIGFTFTAQTVVY